MSISKMRGTNSMSFAEKTNRENRDKETYDSGLAVLIAKETRWARRWGDALS